MPFSLDQFSVDPGNLSYSVSMPNVPASPAMGMWGKLTSGVSGNSLLGGLGSAVAGYAQNKADQKASKRQHAQSLAELELLSKNEREISAAKMASDYFYNRMNRDRKRQGVSSFRQFKGAGAIDQYKNPGV